MSFLITTTGTQTPVSFPELGGRSFSHPTVDYDLQLEFSLAEINAASSVQTAIDNGYITVTDGDGNSISNASILNFVNFTDLSAVTGISSSDEFMLYDGDGSPVSGYKKITAQSLGLPARSIFEVFVHARGSDLYNGYIGTNVGKNSSFYITMRVPENFTSLVSADVFIITETAQAAADIDLTSTYGLVGGSSTLFSESNTAITFNTGSIGDLIGLDVSSVLTGIQADYLLSLEVNQALSVTNGNFFLGLDLHYRC